MQKYAYGDTRLDFQYGNIKYFLYAYSQLLKYPCMHTGIVQIPLCIWGLLVSCDPRIQTGISVIPVCTRGLILIPAICIRGWCVMQSLFAYGNLWYPRMHTGIDLDPHNMHTGIAWHTLAACGLEEHVRITLIFSRIISFMLFTVITLVYVLCCCCYCYNYATIKA
jgi:hypothetical protein